VNQIITPRCRPANNRYIHIGRIAVPIGRGGRSHRSHSPIIINRIPMYTITSYIIVFRGNTDGAHIVLYILYDPNKTGNVVRAVCQKSFDTGRRDRGVYYGIYIQYIHIRVIYGTKVEKYTLRQCVRLYIYIKYIYL